MLGMPAAVGLSATSSGLMFVPSTAFGLTGSLGGGIIMRRTGKYYWITVIGYTLMVLGIAPAVSFSGALVVNIGQEGCRIMVMRSGGKRANSIGWYFYARILRLLTPHR